MTEKIKGGIKARKVADRSNQRMYDGHHKSVGTSLRVVTECIFMTGVVYAKEKTEVAVLDIVKASLQADNNKIINIFLRWELAHGSFGHTRVYIKDEQNYVLRYMFQQLCTS